MSTADCKAQGNGAWTGWSSIVGGTLGYDAIDESATTGHDSDATYIVLPRQSIPSGRVSFRFFDMADDLLIDSITLRVAAKTQSGSPVLEIGFSRAGVLAFSANLFTTSGSYVVASRTFSTNPLSGSAWQDGDLVNLEPCVQMQAGLFASARVTLISATVAYHANRSWRGLRPKGAQAA